MAETEAIPDDVVRHRVPVPNLMPWYLAKRVIRAGRPWQLPAGKLPDGVSVGSMVMINERQSVEPFHTGHVYGDVYFRITAAEVNPFTGKVTHFTVERIT